MVWAYRASILVRVPAAQLCLENGLLYLGILGSALGQRYKIEVDFLQLRTGQWLLVIGVTPADHSDLLVVQRLHQSAGQAYGSNVPVRTDQWEWSGHMHQGYVVDPGGQIVVGMDDDAIGQEHLQLSQLT